MEEIDNNLIVKVAMARSLKKSFDESYFDFSLRVKNAANTLLTDIQEFVKVLFVAGLEPLESACCYGSSSADLESLVNLLNHKFANDRPKGFGGSPQFEYAEIVIKTEVSDENFALDQTEKIANVDTTLDNKITDQRDNHTEAYDPNHEYEDGIDVVIDALDCEDYEGSEQIPDTNVENSVLQSAFQSLPTQKEALLIADKMKEPFTATLYSCPKRCTRKCPSKFSEDERMEIYWQFHLKSKRFDKQLWISNLCRLEKSTGRGVLSHTPPRIVCYLNKVTDDGKIEQVRVCQEYFKGTLGMLRTGGQIIKTTIQAMKDNGGYLIKKKRKSRVLPKKQQ